MIKISYFFMIKSPKHNYFLFLSWWMIEIPPYHRVCSLRRHNFLRLLFSYFILYYFYIALKKLIWRFNLKSIYFIFWLARGIPLNFWIVHYLFLLNYQSNWTILLMSYITMSYIIWICWRCIKFLNLVFIFSKFYFIIKLFFFTLVFENSELKFVIYYSSFYLNYFIVSFVHINFSTLFNFWILYLRTYFRKEFISVFKVS